MSHFKHGPKDPNQQNNCFNRHECKYAWINPRKNNSIMYLSCTESYITSPVLRIENPLQTYNKGNKRTLSRKPFRFLWCTWGFQVMQKRSNVTHFTVLAPRGMGSEVQRIFYYRYVSLKSNACLLLVMRSGVDPSSERPCPTGLVGVSMM